jgi:hypothetical protein
MKHDWIRFQAIQNRQKYWLPVIGVAVVALYVFVIHRWDKSLNPPAMASVEYDAGKVIESRESRPNQRINVADGLFPAEMTFVIPGPRCTLWVSH